MNSPSYDQDDPAQISPQNNNLTSASRRIRESNKVRTTDAPSVSAGSVAVKQDPEYIPLHELAKGWKAAISWATDEKTKGEARKKNDRGNLPLHSAASFRAPVEVIGEFRHHMFIVYEICFVLCCTPFIWRRPCCNVWFGVH